MPAGRKALRAMLCLGVGLSAMSAIAAPAMAQEEETVEESRTLQTVTITATKREQTLQDVPIAVTAITASTAAKLGLTDPIMLSRAAPGMSFGRNGAAATPFIRGVA